MKAPLKKNLREQKKEETHDNVLEVAHRLFRRESFDGTTLQMICSESSISKRTFFRYFRDKESLVFPNREQRLANFERFLDVSKQVDNPFEVLRSATRMFGAKYNKNREHFLAKQAMIQSSPVLVAREQEIDRDWEQAIATSFSARSGALSDDELWARVLSGAIMGIVRATMTYWYERQCQDDLIVLGLDALDYLERGFSFPAPPLPLK